MTKNEDDKIVQTMRYAKLTILDMKEMIEKRDRWKDEGPQGISHSRRYKVLQQKQKG